MHKNFTLPLRIGFFFSHSLFWLIISIHASAQPVTFQAVIQTGLSTPVDVVNAGDNSNRLFIISQKLATIRVYDASYNYLGTLLTVPDVRTSGSEEGLLSIVFHPDYESNRLFFVYYTNTIGDLELARFETTADPLIADPLTKTVILTIPHPVQENHNGGKLNFGSDGYLYFATGDGGSGGDPNDNAQNGTSLLGKMVRINVDPGQPDPYTIPPSNPYVSNPLVRDEIWALGLRNPFRWSFDRANGDMWIGDVGQGNWEEINYKSGPGINTGSVNYGWRCFEGDHPYTSCVMGPGTVITPVFEYPNASPSAITGGIVYRGTEYSDLLGTYVGADFYSGTLYLIKNISGTYTTTTVPGLPDWIAGFGEAENGTLYALSLRGTLYKVNGAIATPVTIVSFTASQKKNVIELAWETSDEVGVQQYEIEFSGNGTDFKKVGIVAAKKSAIYRFNHIFTNDKKGFYRLKILDFDSKFEYSKIIHVNPVSEISGNFVRPSLISDRTLNVRVQRAYSQIQMVSMDGRQVWSQNIDGRNGNLRFVLPSLIPGTYFVRLYGDEMISTQKVFVR